MYSMFILIIISLCFGLAAWLLFLWAVKRGQFDDIERPKYRMLDDDGCNVGKEASSPDKSCRQTGPAQKGISPKDGKNVKT